MAQDPASGVPGTPRLDDAQDNPGNLTAHEHASPDALSISHPDKHNLTSSVSSPIPPPSTSQLDDENPPSQHATTPIDPDNFYKNYRTPVNAESSFSSMAPAATPPTPESNGTDTSSSQSHSPAVPGLRSASGVARGPRPGPSVKDLKKRFDQNGDASVQKTPLRPSNVTAHHRSPHAGPSGSQIQNGAVNQAALRSHHGDRDNADAMAHSANPTSSPQSFANRINNSGGVSASSSASSGIHRGRKIPNPPSSTAAHVDDQPQLQPLLFGEILPQQYDSQSAGHGIDSVRPRRTSESHAVHGSSSDLDLEIVSTTSSYKSAATHHTQHIQDEGSPGAAFHKPRTRSQSDASSHTSSIRTPVARKAGHKSPSPPSSLPTPHSSSKLPIPVRKPSGANTSESTSSSRANSPSMVRRTSPTDSAQTRTAIPPRSKTPTSRARTPTSQAKTPTNSTKERKQVPPSLNNLNSSVHLQAYAGVPPPKLSPPLRSSRPRQPVSSASTVSSRMRSASRARSPHRKAGKVASKGGEGGRRRKISVGPVDFEQRREHIRLAYSKSIRASQALEAKQRAVEQEKADRLEASHTDGMLEHQPPLPVPEPDLHTSETSNTVDNADTAQDDTISARPEQTTVLTISPTRDAFNMPASEDSPTLGLPGTFPQSSPIRGKEERPLSSASIASETTEFDGEMQTNLPVPAQQEQSVPVTIVKPPSPSATLPSRQKSEYQYPFADESVFAENLPINQHAPAVSKGSNNEFETAGDDSATPLIHRQQARSHQPHDSTATIQPFATAGDEQTENTAYKVPFPRMDTQDESECHSDADGVPGTSQRHSTYLGSEYAATDACTEETDDRDRCEPQSEIPYCDMPESNRASTCASSDISGTDDLQHYSQDRGFLTASGSLGLPSSRYRPDRLSHQSTWTDVSVDSSASDFAAMAGNYDSRPASFSHNEQNRSSASPQEEPFSHKAETRYDSSLNSSFSHQLPELDTGEGFSVPYLSPQPRHSLTYLPSPSHEPPPIPKSVSGSAFESRASSTFYEQSQTGSTLLNSERDSEGYASYADTPRSGDATSLETADNESGHRATESDNRSFTQEGDASSKERHRLIQRRNVIKELVDTEAVFVRDMNIVEEIYKGTAEACPRLDDQTVKLIFRNSHEVIEFHTTFLAEIKGAVASVYVPKGGRTAKPTQPQTGTESSQHKSEPSDLEDRDTSIGPVFHRNLEKMKAVHEGFLRNSDQAAKKLIQIQQDSAVKVWLAECNEVAKDLTAAWDLDSLLIKPMQRITKYPNLIMTLLQHTPEDHPDRESLVGSKDSLETAIIEINKTKKNFELVGQIVGRKRKESDVKAGFARAFGKRVDKLQASGSRPAEDPVYAKLNEKFGDDFVQLQVVLRDVEFYTRQVSQYVHEFLQYLSSIELVMRLQPGSYPEIESKWVQFNISMRDLEKAALEDHLALVRKQVIEPFEQVIKAYGNPSLAMKKRQKRRVDYERAEQLRRGGKSLDPKLRELVEQYDALNDTLKTELPKLSLLTEKVGKICLGNFVNIQASWYKIWKEKLRVVLSDCPEKPELEEVVATFHQDYPYAAEQLAGVGILNPDNVSRVSNSTDARSRYSEIEKRGRGSSVHEDNAPSLPTPDLGKRGSAGLTMSASSSTTGAAGGNSLNPHHYYYRDYYSGIQTSATSSGSPRSADMGGSARSAGGTGPTSTRPSTGKSLDSGGLPRQSSESTQLHRPDSNTTNYSNQQQDSGRFSNMFHSALPLSDGPDEGYRSSRASSRERSGTTDGYNVLWLAASLFEFNIETTKREAGYPYLTYQAGEIFDVIAEKGELWLAKNQDDPSHEVGWIWSKHFAKLADS